MKKRIFVLLLLAIFICPAIITADTSLEKGQAVGNLSIDVSIINVYNSPNIIIGNNEKYDKKFMIYFSGTTELSKEISKIEVTGEISDIISDEIEGDCYKIEISENKNIIITENKKTAMYIKNKRNYNKYINLSKNVDNEISERLGLNNLLTFVISGIVLVGYFMLKKRKYK